MNSIIQHFIGETTHYDKKRDVERKKSKHWLKSVSAFANTEGGILLFGIADDDEITGLENAESDAEFISQKIKERIEPYPNMSLNIKCIETKKIILLKISKGYETPYYYKSDGIIEAYMRVGNESVKANVAHVNRLIMQGKNSSYDSLISPYKFQDYSFSKLRERYKLWTGDSLDEKKIISFGMMDFSGNLTNAGALLADESPIAWSRVFCTRWNGLDKSGGKVDALDSAEFSGSLIILLNESLSFIKRNMRKLWKKTDSSRIELPDYPERSVFEALVNAIIHRDYLIKGSEVHIDIFDDKMSIYSPGGMPDGTIIQDRELDEIPSTRRNPVLADIFARLGYMERQGSGLHKINIEYKKALNFTSYMKPEFKSNEVEFVVKLPNLNLRTLKSDMLDRKLDDNLSGNLSGNLKSENAFRPITNSGKGEILSGNLNVKIPDLTDEENLVWHYFIDNFQKTQKSAIEAFRGRLSRRQILKIMSVLQNKGYISHVGSRKMGYWVAREY